jgi:2-methylisocitrate lyase-like PEP mutase family enzyme
MPDLGVVTLNDMSTNAGMIASLDRRVPVIADADTGYGGPIMVSRTVQSYIAAGVAGLHLEDQVVSKRCGHLANKELVDADTYYSRIRAAVLEREEMRQTAGGDIVIFARTDALQSLGYDEAVSRLKRCLELGADGAFLEGPTTLDQCRAACRDLAPAPVLLNMVPGGVTPLMTAAEAKELGFRIMIFPGLALGAVYESVTKACKELKEMGAVDEQAKKMGKGGVLGVFGVCGLRECMEFDAKAGGRAYSQGV